MIAGLVGNKTSLQFFFPIMALIKPDFVKFWPTRSKIITFYHTPFTHLFVRVLGSYDQKGLLVYRYYIIYWPYLHVYDV